jgi:hypothetical protein
MISGFVVGYCIVLANLFYLNNDPLSRFCGLKIKEFSRFLDLTHGEFQECYKISISPFDLCDEMFV